MAMNVETEAKPMVELALQVKSAFHTASALLVEHKTRCSGCGFCATLSITILFLAGARGLIESNDDALALVREAIRSGDCLKGLDAVMSYLKEIKAEGKDCVHTEKDKRVMATIEAAFREVRTGGSGGSRN